MPIVDVPGLGRVQFPEGTSEADMVAAITAAIKPQAPQRAWYENAAIGAGGGMTDMARGLQQRGMEFLNYIGDVPDERLSAFKAETAANRELMQPVMGTAAGKIGYGVGQVAAGAPASFVPGANSYAGAALMGGLYGAAQPTVEGESAAMNTALGAGLGAAGQGVLNTALGAGRRAMAARNAAPGNVRNQLAREALDMGYVLPPSASKPGSVVGSTVEGLGGKIKTAQRAAQRNQVVTNRLIRAELGLADDAPLVPETFAAVRQSAYQAGYEPVKRAGTITADREFQRGLQDMFAPIDELATDFPALAAKARNGVEDVVSDLAKGSWDAKNIVFAIRQFRDRATPLFRSTDPTDLAMAHTNRRAAEMLESLVERNLAAHGDDGLVAGFRAARQQIAKSFDIERAAVGGDIDAQKLGRLLERGKPLSGNTRKIAEIERAFQAKNMSGGPFQHVTTGTPWLSPLDLLGGSIAAGVTMDPRALAMMLGRPALREITLSRPFQTAFARPGTPGAGMAGLLGSALDNPLLQHALRVGGAAGLLPAVQ